MCMEISSHWTWFLGRKERNKNTLYLIDFGLTQEESSLYEGEYDPAIYERDNLILNGTPLFASINLHLGWNKVFKKDDLESLLYMLIYLWKGRLPWSDLPIDGHDNFWQILQWKISTSAEELCSNLPKALTKLANYCTNLQNLAEIDYELIEKFLKEAAEEEGFKLLVSFYPHLFLGPWITLVPLDIRKQAGHRRQSLFSWRL